MTKRKEPPPDSSYSELIENAGSREFTDSVAFMVADKTVDARMSRAKYGPPTESARRVALAWSGVLGHEVRPHQVPICQAIYHAIRLSKDPLDTKSLHDMAGQVRISEVVHEADVKAAEQ